MTCTVPINICLHKFFYLWSTCGYVLRNQLFSSWYLIWLNGVHNLLDRFSHYQFMSIFTQITFFPYWFDQLLYMFCQMKTEIPCFLIVINCILFSVTSFHLDSIIQARAASSIRSNKVSRFI
uniref:Uncharacterized protein n=1 Tax=Zea mays TaxID=4577 RepID=C0PIV5_MAIZE|nr:unknown [Zea mays]